MEPNSNTPIYDGFPSVIYDENGEPVATLWKHPDCPLEKYNEFLSLMFDYGDNRRRDCAKRNRR